MKFLQSCGSVVFWIALAVLVGALTSFFVINKNIVTNIPALVIAFVCQILLATVLFVVIKSNSGQLWLKIIVVVAFVGASVWGIIRILNSFVFTYFQPFSLSTYLSVVTIAAIVLLLVSGAMLFIFSQNSIKALIPIVLVISVLGTFAGWAAFQQPSEIENVEYYQYLFSQNSSEGSGKTYDTFRIPSLIVLDKDSLNEHYGYELTEDMLLATAEGRINNSFDRGDIDMVGKYSLDGGETWSDLFVLFEYSDEVGKFGNPTPVYDKNTGIINFICMTGTEENNYSYTTYNYQGVLQSDFSIKWSEPININEQLEIADAASVGAVSGTLMVGPGKSIMLDSGRLVIPSNQGGYAFAVYSDDGGLTWQKGENAGSGNESEITQLANGELMMVSRELIGAADVHTEQYQRFAYSNDGGLTWYQTISDSTLKTPICMASIVSSNGLVYLSYPDDFLTRANLTIAQSSDNGETWVKTQIYQGAAGYSCLAANSAGELFVLAEIGNINYCETLLFAKITTNSY